MKTITKRDAIRFYSDAIWLFTPENLSINELTEKMADFLIETHGAEKALKIMQFINLEN